MRATVADPFTLTGTDFAPVGGLVDVTFTATAGTPFLGGTSASVHVVGSIASDTTIVGTTPLAVIEEDVLATTNVTFASGACALGSFFLLRAPPVVRAVSSFPGVAGDLFGQTFLSSIPQTMSVFADNLEAGSAVAVYDAAVGPTKPIGSGVLEDPIVTVFPGALDDQIDGIAPLDPDLDEPLNAVVRVTNPDGQIGEFETNVADAPVVFAVSGALSPIPVFEAPGESPGASIAVNPDDPLNVVVVTQELASALNTFVHVSVTHDAGATWDDVTVGPSTADSPDGLADASLRTSPRVAFDDHGSAFLAYLVGGTQISLLVSGDGGDTFTPGTPWGSGGFGPSIDLATGPTTVGGRTGIYVVATVASGAVLLEHHSDALGTFDFTTGVGNLFSDGADPVSQPTVAVGPGGAVYASWVEDLGGGDALVLFDADTDGAQGGNPFGADVTIDQEAGGPVFPAIEASPQAGVPIAPSIAVVASGDHIGRVVVSWTHNARGDALDPELDVVSLVSDDFGATFFGLATLPAVVHPVSGADQFGTALCADPAAADGRLYVTWFDTEDDAGTGTKRWGASSTDGIQWSDPVRLSLHPAPGSDLTGATSVDDYGLFQGCAAFGGSAWAAWTVSFADPDSEPWVTRFQAR
jgi:hypothetical protein